MYFSRDVWIVGLFNGEIIVFIGMGDCVWIKILWYIVLYVCSNKFYLLGYVVRWFSVKGCIGFYCYGNIDVILCIVY